MTKPIKIAKDGTCTCGYDTPCPLGKTGEQPRCTESELNRAGINTARLESRRNKMSPREINEGLAQEGITQEIIAKIFRCTRSNVNQIISSPRTKTGRPSLIREYIASVLRKPFEEVW